MLDRDLLERVSKLCAELHASEMRVQALTASLCAVRHLAAQRDIDRVLTYLSKHI